MRKTYLKNNLGITVDWTYLSKIYFNICNGSITYLGTKTASHDFSVQEKCILKSIFLKELKIAKDS